MGHDLFSDNKSQATEYTRNRSTTVVKIFATFRFGIDNYLIVCTHQRASEYLESRGIRTFLIQNATENVSSSYYGTKNYSPKTHIKPEVTLVALDAGMTGFISFDILLAKWTIDHFVGTIISIFRRTSGVLGEIFIFFAQVNLWGRNFSRLAKHCLCLNRRGQARTGDIQLYEITLSQ